MCAIWGWAQGWWTVAGLLADIFGFALLAIDVGREYMRHRKAVTLEEAAESGEWLLRERDKTLKLGVELGQLKQDMRDVIRRTQEMMIRAAEITGDPSGKIAAIEDLTEKIEAFRALAKSVREQPFKRAPIMTGIFFVILGFVLQVVGAVPCT